ncbi:MAG: response regulator [Planctomycetes bacterium]|nr:response regulator [Planctomycetota bacterium]
MDILPPPGNKATGRRAPGRLSVVAALALTPVAEPTSTPGGREPAATRTSEPAGAAPPRWPWSQFALGLLVLGCGVVFHRQLRCRDREGVAELAAVREDLRHAHTEMSALRAVLDAQAIVSITDRSGRIVDANPNFCALSGYSREQLIGQHHRIVNSGHHPPEFWRTMWATVRGGDIWRGEVCNRKQDGSTYWVRSVVAPLRNRDGCITHFVSVRTDITAWKLAEAQLIRARQAAEAASQAKSEFLANMSHEIRTPLTAVIGYADMLEDTLGAAAQPAAQPLLQSIRDAGRHLLTVLNDILDLAKIEAGRLELQPEPTDLIALVHGVAERMRPGCDQKQVRFALGIDGDLPAEVIVDATRLRQVVLNVLGNAVKFTTHGSVRFGVSAQRREGQYAHLTFDVSDTGIGIDAARARELFQPFTQANGGVTRAFGGTGLGLAISRRLATAMGGDLQLVTSCPGQGSHFRIEVVVALAATAVWQRLAPVPAPRAEPSIRLPGRILVAEDGRDNQRLLKHFLSRAGAEVDVADDGAEAWRLLQARLGIGTAYDLVITDMQMPVMDGYTLAAHIRDAGLQVPVLALTAHAMKEDRQRCLRAGCDDFLTKPIDRQALLQVCHRLLQGLSYAP